MPCRASVGFHPQKAIRWLEPDDYTISGLCRLNPLLRPSDWFCHLGNRFNWWTSHGKPYLEWGRCARCGNLQHLGCNTECRLSPQCREWNYSQNHTRNKQHSLRPAGVRRHSFLRRNRGRQCLTGQVDGVHSVSSKAVEEVGKLLL